MTPADLTSRHCKPLTEAEARQWLLTTPGWRVESGKLLREFPCKDFREAIQFINRVAQIAEEEGHHPDLHLTQYKNLQIVIWTHVANGLTENDFILAAKIAARREK